jgi:hypothetical protein
MQYRWQCRRPAMRAIRPNKRSDSADDCKIAHWLNNMIANLYTHATPQYLPHKMMTIDFVRFTKFSTELISSSALQMWIDEKLKKLSFSETLKKNRKKISVKLTFFDLLTVYFWHASRRRGRVWSVQWISQFSIGNCYKRVDKFGDRVPKNSKM